MDQVRAFTKYASSFLKRTWSLEDYPVRLRKIGPRVPGSAGLRGQVTWNAQIINWWHMRGVGSTPEVAMESLARRLAGFAASHPLPRPGRGAPLKVELADSTLVEANKQLIDDILERVIGFSATDCLVTDESTLWDFQEGDDNREYFRKISLIYGVDVSDIEPPTLAEIAERIRLDRLGA
jgi:hypothetical protein